MGQLAKFIRNCSRVPSPASNVVTRLYLFSVRILPVASNIAWERREFLPQAIAASVKQWRQVIDS